MFYDLMSMHRLILEILNNYRALGFKNGMNGRPNIMSIWSRR